MQDLPVIWEDIAPMKKEKARTALEIERLTQAQDLRLKPLKITHTVAALLISLAFHIEDPGGVSNTVSIFKFPNLSLAAGTEISLVAQQWDTVL